jgi:hypothetical protein
LKALNGDELHCCRDLRGLPAQCHTYVSKPLCLQTDLTGQEQAVMAPLHCVLLLTPAIGYLKQLVVQEVSRIPAECLGNCCYKPTAESYNVWLCDGSRTLPLSQQIIVCTHQPVVMSMLSKP